LPYTIGLFDSGIGGLTVMREIRRRFPHHHMIYLGDTKHVPYGNRHPEELIRLAFTIVDFLVAAGANIIVDACNTTSALALPLLKKAYNLPFIGVIEPGAREALRLSPNKRIGVWATQATVASQAHLQAIKSLDPEAQVFLQACPCLVPLIEAGKTRGPEVERAVREYMAPLEQQDIDTLILGCTHYPFLTPVIKKMAQKGIKIVDPALPTAAELEGFLPPENALSGEKGQCLFYVTGDPGRFAEIAFQLLGWPELKYTQQIKLEKLPLAL